MTSILRALKRRSEASSSGPPAPTQAQCDSLLAAHVPLVGLPDPCRTCDDPCDGEAAYAKLDIDMTETDLLGTVNEYGRLAVIATNASNWDRDISSVSGSLAELVDRAYAKSEKASGHSAGAAGKDTAAVFPSSLDARRARRPPHRKLTLLNGSNVSPSSDASILLFPDYKIAQGITVDAQGASSLVSTALSPDVGPATPSTANKPFRSWPLAYRAVILLCSHKRRDKRCHIVAPLLRAEFTRALEAEGLTVDERGDEAEHGPEPCIEDWPEVDDAERESRYDTARRAAAASDTVGIFNVSHIGGHRYAGNAVLCFPSGASIWYGRVSPREVEAIVKETILGGRVIAELLRGGFGIGGKPQGVLAW